MKTFIFVTKSVSNGELVLTVATLMNSIPKVQLLLTRNLEVFSLFRGIMHEVPEVVLAAWKLWLPDKFKHIFQKKCLPQQDVCKWRNENTKIVLKKH